MMKRICLLLLLFSGLLTSAHANHITGGEIYYTLINQSGGNYTYAVTLKLYRDHFSTGAALDASAAIAIFNRGTNQMVWSSSVPRTNIQYLELTSPDQCIVNPPIVYYDVGHYNFTVTLPASANGYVITYQRCCRIAGINNLQGSNSVGATYTAEIPGTNPVANGPANNSAHFVGPDTVIVCQQTGFTYSFNATDADGDQLVYYFCDAYSGGSTANPAPNPPSAPPYTSVPYAPPFWGGSPMGTNVTLDPATGLMSGIAPDVGIYVVTVCVNEIRNGVVIATQRKDLQIKVGDCSMASVNLAPQVVNCESFTQTFSNGGDQSAIHSYLWNFGDPASGANDTSTLPNPTHTFTDTGVYTVTLITNAGEPCSDTGTTTVRIFPGFFAGFVVPTSGTCITQPVQFIDTTRTVYGFVNSWSWNFGVPGTAGDTSHVQNPLYQYPAPGVYDVQLIVTCSKGCVDTVTSPVNIYDKPPLNLNTKDTLKCLTDSVQLVATGNGVFSWTPASFISNTNVPNPFVYTPSTTWYYVTLNDNGCVNNDSVKVNVVNSVSLTAMPDTVGCQGDQFQLRAQTNGLQHQWSPVGLVNDPNILNPTTVGLSADATFQIVSTIGSCTSTDYVRVKVVPYPGANAGPNDTICYNTTSQLNAAITGSRFTWAPTNSLSNPNSLNPIATPSRTTAYVLTVYDTLGCPKPTRDTVTVVVLPKVNAFAGRDTAVVVGQPLQFHATGGVNYLWSPATGLNNINIADPIGLYDGSIDSIRYRVLVSDANNCVDSAFVTVAVFNANPQIFVPTAFTPNGDGINDLFRPLGVGIKDYQYFKVFNRWGQLVFSTTINGHGWDGKIGGKEQPTGTYVWIVKGIDYLKNPFFKKGTVILIR